MGETAMDDVFKPLLQVYEFAPEAERTTAFPSHKVEEGAVINTVGFENTLTVLTAMLLQEPLAPHRV